MADAALRTRALSLYRSLMRSCRTWPGPPNEKQYIYEEASVLFRKDQHLTDPAEIAKKIDEAEKRYHIAWHYKIPYPRVPNYPLGAFQEKPETVYQMYLRTTSGNEDVRHQLMHLFLPTQKFVYVQRAHILILKCAPCVHLTELDAVSELEHPTLVPFMLTSCKVNLHKCT